MKIPRGRSSTVASIIGMGVLATGVLGGLGGGAYLAATSAIATTTAAAIGLGALGAVGGLVVGAAAGVAGFIATHTIDQNKEYIALGVGIILWLPIAIANAGIKKLTKGKIFSRKPKTEPSPPFELQEKDPMTSPITPASFDTNASAKTDLNTASKPAEPKVEPAKTDNKPKDQRPKT